MQGELRQGDAGAGGALHLRRLLELPARGALAKDPFSDARYTKRQETLQKASGARFVYTPQIVVGGRDMPDWRSALSIPFNVLRIHLREAKAALAIDATVADDAAIRGAVDASLAKGTPAQHLSLVVVALQNGLARRVTAGANRGEVLQALATGSCR
jgi:hypothetical protein